MVVWTGTFGMQGRLETNAVISAVIPGQNTEVCAHMNVLFTPRCEAFKVSRQSWHMLAGITI